ncbi:hypothetical protein ABPG75_010835 [Micractinium tetrahymenae]
MSLAASWDTFPVNSGFVSGPVSHLDIIERPLGTFVYLAYSDAGRGSKATVLQYGISGWQAFGLLGFTPGGASWLRLAKGLAGAPLLAFSNASQRGWAAGALGGGKGLAVMQYSDGSWQYLGGPAVSKGAAYHISMARSPDGTLAAAYQDVAEGGKLTVQRWSGAS